MDAMRVKFEQWAQGCGWEVTKVGPPDDKEWGNYYTSTAVRCMWDAWQAATAAEREACAEVCENLYYGLRIQPTRSECAEAIRARGENE